MCYPVARKVNTMRDLPAARWATCPGMSARLSPGRPSHSRGRCRERRQPYLFGRPDFCTISAPFLHHELQFQELCSPRAPKGDDKSRHGHQPRSRGRQSAPSKLAEPSRPAHIASVIGSLLSVKEPSGTIPEGTPPKTLPSQKENFGKETVKFCTSHQPLTSTR